MAEFHDLQLFTFNIEGITLKNFGCYQRRRKLTREAWFPEGLNVFRIDLVLNGCNDGPSGDCPCVGESVEQLLQPEKVVAVRMCDVDGCKIFAARNDPLQEFLCVLFR